MPLTRKQQREEARAERKRLEAEAIRSQKRSRVARVVGVGVGVVVLLALAVLVGTNKGGANSAGPTVGRAAPNFQLADAVSGKQVSPASLRGQKTLLFFSEGVSCQACMQQIADLQSSGVLRKAGVQLVSVTTDNASDLKTVAQQYGITTPLLADSNTQMSAAYGMLGHGGMQHPTQDGHAFMLLSSTGQVMWHHAYSNMYVDPNQLMRDMSARIADTAVSNGMGNGQ